MRALWGPPWGPRCGRVGVDSCKRLWKGCGWKGAARRGTRLGGWCWRQCQGLGESGTGRGRTPARPPARPTLALQPTQATRPHRPPLSCSSPLPGPSRASGTWSACPPRTGWWTPSRRPRARGRPPRQATCTAPCCPRRTRWVCGGRAGGVSRPGCGAVWVGGAVGLWVRGRGHGGRARGAAEVVGEPHVL
jgi:hypothetical protein